MAVTTGLSLRKKKENTALPREVAMTLVHLVVDHVCSPQVTQSGFCILEGWQFQILWVWGVTGTCPRTLINEHQFPKKVDIIFS